METEEDAKDTCLDLRLKKRTFRSQPVKARIKTEPVARSYFPVNPAAVVSNVQFPMVPYPVVPLDLSSFGYLPVPPVVDASALPPIPTAVPSLTVDSTTSVGSVEAAQDGGNDDDVEKLTEDGNEGCSLFTLSSSRS
jgi:hypothetical protein